MVGAGKDHALDAVPARGLVEVDHAGDVGRQNRRPGLLGGDAAHVNNGVHALHQRHHGGLVLQRAQLDVFTGLRLRRLERVDVAQAQLVAIAFQADSQLAAQATGGACEQEAGKTQGGGGAGKHGAVVW